MNKGCLIAAGTVAAVIFLCCGGTFFVAIKYGNPLMLAQIETDIALYRKAHPEAVVEPTNEAWAAILAAPGNGLERQAFWVEWVKQGDGTLMDVYQSPIRLELQADSSLRAFSNGKDGLPNTADDESSESVREMLPAQ